MTTFETTEISRLGRERCCSLIAAIAQVVWTTDACGQVIEDQPGWQAFTGQTSEEIRGTGWLAALYPDAREAASSDWADAVARGQRYKTTWRLRRRDGEYRSFSIHAAPVCGDQSAVREWVGCNIDITEHQQRDEERLRLHAKTSAAVAQLERQGREMQILQNLGDTLQACNSREEAYPFIALAATELFPGGSGALAVPVANVRELLETVTEWGGDPLKTGGWMRPDFAIEDCWALRRGVLHEPGTGTRCHHFRNQPDQPYVYLPLAVRGQVSGLLSVRFKEHPDERQRALLSTFGNAMALGLATLQLRETWHEQAIRGRGVSPGKG
jgi:PAS domain S-box-containing protein